MHNNNKRPVSRTCRNLLEEDRTVGWLLETSQMQRNGTRLLLSVSSFTARNSVLAEFTRVHRTIKFVCVFPIQSLAPRNKHPQTESAAGEASSRRATWRSTVTALRHCEVRCRRPWSPGRAHLRRKVRRSHASTAFPCQDEMYGCTSRCRNSGCRGYRC